MVVHQLNKVSCDRIIKAADIDRILSIEEYVRQTKAQADEVMQKAAAEVAELKEQAYAQTVNELIESNKELLADLEQRLAKFLAQISQDMQKLILKILTKLGLDDLSPSNLSSLLRSELDRFQQIDKVKLEAHPTVIQVLQYELSKFGERCEFEPNPRMSGLECICTTHFWTLRLDINTVVSKLTTLLASEKTEQIN